MHASQLGDITLHIHDASYLHYPTHACASRNYVIGAGVHLYIYVYMCSGRSRIFKKGGGHIIMDL